MYTGGHGLRKLCCIKGGSTEPDENSRLILPSPLPPPPPVPALTPTPFTPDPPNPFDEDE